MVFLAVAMIQYPQTKAGRMVRIEAKQLNFELPNTTRNSELHKHIQNVIVAGKWGIRHQRHLASNRNIRCLCKGAGSLQLDDLSADANNAFLKRR